jgi:hypothetical protein
MVGASVCTVAGIGGQERAVVGQRHILRADLLQLLHQQMEQIELPGRAGGGRRGGVGRGVDLDVAQKAFFQLVQKGIVHR